MLYLLKASYSKLRNPVWSAELQKASDNILTRAEAYLHNDCVLFSCWNVPIGICLWEFRGYSVGIRSEDDLAPSSSVLFPEGFIWPQLSGRCRENSRWRGYNLRSCNIRKHAAIFAGLLVTCKATWLKCRKNCSLLIQPVLKMLVPEICITDKYRPEGVSKSLWSESITKSITNTRWEASWKIH